jgi:O-antigen/teichoic acid export membrane protein
MAKLISLAAPAKLHGFVEHLRTPLFRNGYALIASTGITSVLGLLYWAIAARFYGTEAVGLNSMAISVMIFMSGIAQINLQETMIRFIPQAGKKTLRLVVSAYALVIGLSIITGIVFCLGVALWSPALAFLISSPDTILWFTCAIIFWSLFVVEDSVLVGLRQALWIPLENAIFSVLKIGLLILLAAALPQTGIFMSWTVAVAVIIVPINFLIFRRLIPNHTATAHPTTTPIRMRQLSKYIAGNYVAALLSNMASALLPLIITQMAGAEANAHFYLAWIVAGALQIITANMATSLTVEAATNSANLAEYRRRALSGIARLLVPLVVLVIVFAPLILRLMGPSYLAEGTLLLQLLAVAAIPNLYTMLYIGLARVQNRIAGIIAVYGANALFVLGLSTLLLPSLGISGVGFAWVISQTVIALALWSLTWLQSRRAAPVISKEQ